MKKMILFVLISVFGLSAFANVVVIASQPSPEGTFAPAPKIGFQVFHFRTRGRLLDLYDSDSVLKPKLTVTLGAEDAALIGHMQTALKSNASMTIDLHHDYSVSGNRVELKYTVSSVSYY